MRLHYARNFGKPMTLEEYYWPQLQRDLSIVQTISDFQEACAKYQALYTSSSSNGQWADISMESVIGLPKTS